MKNLIIIAVLFIALPVFAQRSIEKSATVKTKQNITLNFKFAENIKIVQWNKNEVLAKASVNIDDGEGNEYFSIKTENSDNTLYMRSDFGEYYKKRKNKGWNDCDRTAVITYVVYVPANTGLRVKSISGDVETDEFKGTLKTELVSGDVLIKNYDGELWLKTVSGDLDVSIKKAEINAKTLSGSIYSNLEIDMDGNSKSSSYNRIRGTVNSGGELVRMETVSGDIYMRKI